MYKEQLKRQKMRRDHNIKNNLCVDCSSPDLFSGTLKCKKHILIAREASRRKWTNQRNKVLDAYGNRCACCGETKREFLAIDHVNNDGSGERKKVKNKMVQYIIQQGYPKDKYRVLCHNCNSSIGFYGYCPHKVPQEGPV